MPATDKVERMKITSLDGVDEFFGLLLVLLERGAGGKFRHTKLLSDPQKAGGASGVRTGEAERRFGQL
jgi:hypothetical protein